MKTATIEQPIADFQFATTEDPQACFSDLRGKTLVLYFYPKDSTPGCTQESKDFRDLYPQFLADGIHVLGVSRDSLKSHEKFKNQCELPFPLISDQDSDLCHYFGVIKEKSMFGKLGFGIERSTFLIDKQGILRQEWRKVKVDGHVKEVLSAAQKLSND